jgi:hypothetical protein
MRCGIHVSICCLIGLLRCFRGGDSWGQDVPTDNPVATHYPTEVGYPAWTDRVDWSNVINMKSYDKGKTNFEKFENARDELAAAGGGVLYYPAGVYDFSEGPFDGPDGRGLMLKSGVVIRGETPSGEADALSGDLKLPTRFVFGFVERSGAIDVGERLLLELDGGDIRLREDKKTKKVVYEPASLLLNVAAKDGKVRSDATGYRRGYGRDRWPGKVKASQSGDNIKLAVELDVRDDKFPGQATYEISLKVQDEKATGKFIGKCRDQKAGGNVSGQFTTIRPETPRDWNLVGLAPENGKGVKDVDTVGVCWVHLEGAVVYFGPDIQWGSSWAAADSWKSAYALFPWSHRKPDGTHPWDPFAGGGKVLKGMGDGRLVFGCQFEDAAVLNESVTMGRPDYQEGFGPGGYYMYKFGPRIGAYGSRVFIANNVLAKSRGRNFKYQQTTRRTFPSGGGSGMGFDSPRTSTILFDYNKTCGIDVNKSLLGLTKDAGIGPATEGYFFPGVAVIDNYVYNNGHKGFNLSGNWVTIARNHNERQMLREGCDPERIGGWELTLDGHLETSPGGNGAISDNLSRAFDLGGKNVWIHKNTYNNLGSDPGNDGEGILCQAHGGTQIYSWAITYNKHEKGDGESGYIGGWDVNMAGALFGWNEIPGWIGAAKAASRKSADTSFVGNRAGGGEQPMAGAQVGDPGGRPTPPKYVDAKQYEGDAVEIAWHDAARNEVGFRVDRRIEGGEWRTIAYRPPQITGHAENPPKWIDFLAPSGVPLAYRVVALGGNDNDDGASESTRPVTIGN